MKVICLLSCGPGHLDFGGMGYLNLAKGLQQRGHTVLFFSVAFQCQKLQQLGFNTAVIPYLDNLWMLEEGFNTELLGDNFINSLKTIELLIKKENPGLVLVDSLLALGSGLLETLGIPFVSIGSPGGNWKKNVHDIIEGTSLHNVNGLTQWLRERLHWPLKGLSAYCNSPFHNITFIGNSFYENLEDNNTSVNLFTTVSSAPKSRVAISLGSGTYHQSNFVSALSNTLKKFPDSQLFDVYGYEYYIASFLKDLPDDLTNRIRVRGFVPFATALLDVKTLLFPGGIGTTWLCIQYGVMPLVISGGVHDQNYNAAQLKRLGLGDTGQLIQYSPACQSTLTSLKNEMTFDETLPSMLDKLENIS